MIPFDFTPAAALAEIFGNVDSLLLVMVRIFGFMVIMPGFSGQTVPGTAKAAMAFVFGLIVMSTGQVTAPEMDGVFQTGMVILNEFLAGFFIGFTASILFAIFHMIGQQVDFKIGFMMMSIHDPITQTQTPVTGNLFYFVFLTFFISQGGLSLVIYYTLGTYSLIPPGNAFILGNAGLVMTIMNVMGIYLELGLLFAIPIIAVTTIIDVGLGILVKAVPQMNVFVVGMPLKVGIGILIIYLMVPYWYDIIYRHFFYDVLSVNIRDTVHSMVPAQ